MKTLKRLHFNSTSSFRNVRRSTVWAVLCLAVYMSGAGIFAMAQSPRIIEFDAPGAASTPGLGLGTQGVDINPAGAIAGVYSDANNVMHGFLRTPEGRLITFDAPGAGSVPGLYFKQTPAGVYGGSGTYPFSNNREGAITGFYFDENTLGHGFVRAPDGTFTSFDDPDVGTTSPQGTFALNINPAGVIAGNYFDSNSIHHGFVRTPHNKFTNFDPTGSVFTHVDVGSCINPAGAVTGYYLDAGGLAHSFVRALDGRITEFDVPGAGTDGSQGQGTYAEANNDAGVVTGQYYDSNDVSHGFVRAPDGKFTYFDAPGAGADAASYEGTIPLAINAAGGITGAYIDSNWVLHGFLRLPGPPQF